MAVCRWLYRRKRSVFLTLFVTSGWIAYFVFTDSPDLDERKKVDHNVKSSQENNQRAISHQYFVDNSVKDNKDNVLEPPKIQVVNINDAQPKADNKDENSNVLEPPKIEVINVNDAAQKEKTVSPQKNASKTLEIKTTNISTTVLKEKVDKGHLDNLLQIGEKIKDKTFEIGKKFKNKTIAVGAVLGVIKPRNKTKYVFYPLRFNLSVSFEDIGNIMKDTKFLNKLQPLDLNGPVLSSTKNRTASYTYKMSYHSGFCDCWERHCLCCAKISNKRLHLNTTMCSNFTFMSKSHELDLQVILDGQIIHKTIISADEPPLLCLGSIPKVADICVHFFNVTFKVNGQDSHKTQLLGCTDFSLNLYNRTIGAHPVDCFQIPGDPNQKHKDQPFNLFGNWMP